MLTEAIIKNYITPNNSLVKKVASTLENPRMAFSFVRDRVEYTHDPKGKDIWQLPHKTLIRMHGDCEDMSFLIASILKNYGYRVKIVGMEILEGIGDRHMLVEVLVNKGGQLSWVPLDATKKNNKFGLIKDFPKYKILFKTEV